ncbi:MAG: nucleotide exchange factor GrpE [Bacteroidia bacterium]|nr:nucleotide exchange factor GrpE [Bacteroidia bacterium]
MASNLMYKNIVMASKKSTEKEKEQFQQPENMAENTVNQEQVKGNESELESNQTEDAALVESNDAESTQSEKEKYLRLYSEFENFRRRTTKERLEWMQNASKDMIEAVLPVVDDMERALSALKNAGDSTASEGMELIFKKLYGILERKGLKPMNAKGEDFNPDLHEAVTQFAAPSPELVGKVIDEVEKGYFLNDKVLRFAKVVVGN